MTTTPSIYSLPHQKAVINHLVASCPGQRGLVVAHQMGGGKTLTALMMLRNYPKSKHVIVCPPFLKDLYDRENRILFGKPLNQGTTILAYDDFATIVLKDPAFLQNAVLIMDEAHYLVPIFESLDLQTFETFFASLTTKPKKYLLLTGTPVYNTINDLQLLVNLAAGREVLPFRQTDYIREFTLPHSTMRTAFWGYFIPTLQTITDKFISGVIFGLSSAFLKDAGKGALVTGGMQVISLSLFVLNRFVTKEDPMFFRKYNVAKIKQSIGPYVSTFKLKPGTLGVPRPEEKVEHFVYDTYQLKLWTRMLYNELTDEDVQQMGIVRSTAEQLAFTGSRAKEMVQSMYVKWGRMVSNTSPRGKYPPKFHKCFENMVKRYAPREFIVVYTDFQASHDKFLAFLQYKVQQGESFTFSKMTSQNTPAEKSKILKDFAQGNINILVLGVGMYEGISILRASQFHVLDPLENFKDFAQLYGRVARLHSHDGLPVYRQRVKYYLYVASFDVAKITSLATPDRIRSIPRLFGVQYPTYYSYVLKLYVDSQSYKFHAPQRYSAPIVSTVTAEFTAYRRVAPLQELLTQLDDISGYKTTLPKMQCCPTYERDGISEDCLLAHITNPCVET